MLPTRSLILAFMIAGTVAGPPLQAEEPDDSISLSIEAAVGLALSRNPNAIEAAAGVAIADARLDQVRSRWLPQIEASQTWSRGDHPVFVFGSLLEQGRFGPDHFDPAFLNDPPTTEHYRLAIDLKMPIFDQLERVSATRQARIGLDQSRLESSAAHQRLRLETLEAYYGVLVARSARDVARDAVATAAADVGSIRDRFDSGLIVESDLLAAEVQLAELRQQEITASGNVAVATARLRALLDLSPVQRVELTSDFPAASFTPLPLEEQLRLGRSGHPEIISSGHAAKIADLEVTRARGRYLPRLDGFATIAMNGDALGEDLSNDQLLGLRLSFSLYEPGRAGRVAEAAATRLAAQSRRDGLENEITVRIVSAWETFQTAQQRVEVAERSLLQAREAMRIVRNRYEEGLVTITEQLRAQTAVLRAELNHLTARHETTIGYARLLRATGRLTDVEPFLD